MLLTANCSRWPGTLVADDVSVPERSDAILNLNVSAPAVDEEVVFASSPIISDAFKDDFNIYGNLLLGGTIAVFGTGANLLNMVVFYTLGLKDSTSVGLMALAFTDFLVTLFGIAGTICFTLDTYHVDTNSDVSPVDVYYLYFGWISDVIYLTSGWITSFLSIERCVCVITPFRVRQIFTRNRSLVAILIIYLVNFGVHMPVFLSQWLARAVVECRMDENGTVTIKERMIVHVSDNRDQIQIYIDIANGAVLPVSSQAIVLVSVIWMIVGLQASSRIRGRKGGDAGNAKGITDESNGSNNGAGTSSSRLSGKENRLVKVVLFLAIILIVCSIPRYLAVYAKHIFTQVSFKSDYSNLYLLLWNVSVLTQVFNSSVNIFVYFIVNSNYRQTVLQLVAVDNDKENNKRKIKNGDSS